jgi:hypothetical protein
MKLCSAGIKRQEMIRVALTDAAYDAIASTLPKGVARGPMRRDSEAIRNASPRRSETRTPAAPTRALLAEGAPLATTLGP